MIRRRERPADEESRAGSALPPAGTAPPPPPSRRSRLKPILEYAYGTALALIGAALLGLFAFGFFEGWFEGFFSSSPGAPGDPSSVNVIDSDVFWSPDSRSIAFDRSDYGPPGDKPAGSSDVYVASADGRELRRLTRTPSDETVHGWLSDPLRIVYSIKRPKRPLILYALDVNGGAPVKLGELGATDELLALSHDARRVLVGTPRLDPKRYALVDLERKTRRPLPGRGSFWWANGAWSQDDSMLAYGTDTSIVILRGERLLRRVPHPASSLAWSPDGRLLACDEGFESSSIWLVRIRDGTRWRLAGGGDTSDAYPVWSPDGNTIYYEHGSFGDHDGLRAIAPDGSGDRKITNDEWAGPGLFNFEGKGDRWLDSATISPDGTRIAYLLGERGAWKNWSLVGVMNADGSEKRPFPGSP